MFGSIRFVTLSLLVIAGQSHAGAGPDAGTFSKGPFACFADVCIGDRIEDLSNFELLPAPPLGRPSHPLDGSQDAYPAMHRGAFGFWDPSLYRTFYVGRFDATFIPIAPQYASFCPQQLQRYNHHRVRTFVLTGVYKTDSGLLTEVEVDLNPDATDPGLLPRFYVTQLKRFVPVADFDEGERVVRSVKERYSAFMPGPDNFRQVAKQKTGVMAMFKHGQRQPGVEITITLTDGKAFGGNNADWSRVASSARCSTGATPGID